MARVPGSWRGLAAVLFAFAAGLLWASPAAAFVPTGAYKRLSLHGFTVLLSPEVEARAGQRAEAVSFIGGKLADIIRLLPKDDVESLRQVTIWVEWDEEPVQASTYNPSAQWLEEHGRNPDKAKGVEITNLRHFIDWGRTDQPMILLHELSHAYHDQVLGYEYQPILDAYQHALKSGLYASVPYVHGGLKRAYALTNEKEFFAELTEAYFGRNDFFPFTRADLKSYDPVGYALMRSAWEPGGG